MAGVVAIFIVLATMWSFDQMVRQQHLKDTRERAQKFAHVIYENLTTELTKRLSMVDSLAAFWGSNTDNLETSFQSYAKSMLDAYASGVRNLQLAPGGVVTYVYPLEGNESALGFKILEHPQQNEAAVRAIKEQGMVVAGPFELIQGGIGIVARRPLFMPGDDGAFWGFATVILDFPPIVQGVKQHAEHSDYLVAIRGRDGLGVRGPVFYGQDDVFENDPVLVDVSLPNGSWQIGIMPQSGWSSSPPSSNLFWLFGLIIAVFAGVLVYWLVLTMQRLRLAHGRAEKSEAMIRSMYHRTPVMLHSIDHRGNLITVSDYWLECMGYTREEVIGRNSADLLTPESRQYAREVVLPEFFKEGHCENVEYQFIRKDGSVFDGCLSAVLERDKSGNPIQSLAVTLDVTERNNAERLLKTAKDEAEQANMAKTKFLAAASHDLRQPLQAANLFLYALGVNEHRPEDREIISNIAASVESLDNLLNSLLDISRLEAGLVEPQIRALPVANVIERLASEYAQIAEDEKAEIKVVSSTAVVLTDPVLLESIMRNLLSNALKNARNGKILFGCRRHENSVTLEVWDNGSGIPADRLTDIFTEFVQIGNEGRDRSRGLGLGLSIVDKLAGLLDHRIAVRSWEGKGSAFSVELPLMVEEEAHDLVRAVSTFAPPTNMSVFIIEDEPSVRASLSLVLEGQGYEVHAISGNDFHECKRIAFNMASPPDIILADFRLQGGRTGIEATNCVRETFNKSIPAVLLTGDTAPDRLLEAKSSGLPILHKPINVDDLMQEMAKAIKAGE